MIGGGWQLETRDINAGWWLANWVVRGWGVEVLSMSFG